MQTNLIPFVMMLTFYSLGSGDSRERFSHSSGGTRIVRCDAILN